MVNGAIVDVLVIAGVALGIIACGATAGLNSNDERTRFRYGVVAVIVVALAFSAGVLATQLTTPERHARNQIAAELERLGFVAPKGYTLSSAGLYRFDPNSLTSGTVSVASGKRGKARFVFRIVDAEIHIGCRDRDEFRRAGPFARPILIKLGGCAGLQ